MEKGSLSVFSLALVALILFPSSRAYAETPPSDNASILFQQLDTSGTPLNIQVQGGSGGGNYAQFVGQREGSMPPYLRLRMKMVNNFATSGPLIHFDATSRLPITLDLYNLSGACHMMRTEYFPASWVNDGLYHDFDWSPGSPQYQPYLVVCAISPGVSYNVGVITWYSNIDLLAAADSGGVPYMINSTDPLDQTFPPAGPVPATSPTTGLIWQSAPSHSDEVSLYSNFTNPPAFNGTRWGTVIPLGTWTGADFTTDASTTIHIWDRSGDPVNWTILDVGLAASSGGNPYAAHPTSVTHLIYGYPYDNAWIAANAPAATTTQELVLPTNLHSVIHHGDEMWGFLYPSFAAPFYFGGVNVFMGGTGNVPQYQICQGSCDSAPPPPPPCTENCFDNVLFLPGIESSRLYRPDGSGEKRLWEPGANADAFDLTVNPDGSSQRSDIYTRDVLDNAYIFAKGDVYKSFIADMNNLKSSGAINDWEAAPYDWRLTLEQILSSGSQTGSNISYLTATDTPFIIQELRRLAKSSKTGKVTIVAHSNGGLVAKALMQKLGPTVTAQLIDKVILVAVPQVGTPQALAGLLHGHGQALPFARFPYALHDDTARQVGDTMPGLYILLPSAPYFTYVDDPVITFATSSMTDWISFYGGVIHSQEREHTFLTDTVHRTQPAVSDLLTPTILSEPFLAQAESAHQTLDAWTPPAGVQVIQIAGWGVPTTISGIDYTLTFNNGHLTVAPFPRFVIDGDGTVVVPSALWMSTTTTAAINYWLDLNKYNNKIGNQATFGLLSVDHGLIFQIRELRDFIKDQILQVSKPLVDYSYLSITQPASNDKRLRYTLHSPLTLNLYDNLGNHTGISTSTGEVDEEVPGTYYAEFGDIKYIFTDASSPVHVLMDGYANGTFTFNVDELRGDAFVASTTFQDIPTTPDTIVTLDTQSGISSLSPMRVDENGDGTADFTLSPKLNDIVTLDTTAPTTTGALSGTLGKNNWYTSDVLVTLNATDTESGVKATYFSLDGVTTTATSTMIATEGAHTLAFFSEDNAGNRETPQTLAFKLDKTPPEAKFIFNPATQLLDIIGMDHLSSTTVQTTATSSLITDAAGHTLQLLLTQPKAKVRRISMTFGKVLYDSVATTVPSPTSLKYKWNANAGATYKMLAAFLSSGTSTIESHFRPKKNTTILTFPPRDLNDSEDDDDSDTRPLKQTLPGMVLPYLITDKGKIFINY